MRWIGAALFLFVLLPPVPWALPTGPPSPPRHAQAVDLCLDGCTKVQDQLKAFLVQQFEVQEEEVVSGGVSS